MKNKSTIIIILLIILIIAVIVGTIAITSSNKENTATTNTSTNIQASNATNTTNAQTSKENTTQNTNKNTNTNANTNANTSTNTSKATNTVTQNTATPNTVANNNSGKDLLYIGTKNNYKTYEITVNKELEVTDQAEALINEIGFKLGYQIMVKDISSGKGGMTIDFDKDSAPFDLKNTYRGNGEEVHKVSGEANIANTIFDSIKETLQKYFGATMDVYFQKDSKDIEINNVTPAIKINSLEPYKGSK